MVKKTRTCRLGWHASVDATVDHVSVGVSVSAACGAVATSESWKRPQLETTEDHPSMDQSVTGDEQNQSETMEGLTSTAQAGSVMTDNEQSHSQPTAKHTSMDPSFSPTTKAAKQRKPRGVRKTWAPGQWEAWKAHLEQETRMNTSQGKAKPLKTIVEEFNALHVHKGWIPKTMDAIRTRKCRMGEGNPVNFQCRLTQRERLRALELFQINNRSWIETVKQFNKETGHNLTRGALIQSVRRAAPIQVSTDLSISGDGRTKRPWTREELQELMKHTKVKPDDQQQAYMYFLAKMKLIDDEYKPRTYQSFLTQLGRVRRSNPHSVE